MKICSKFSTILGVTGLMLASAWAGPAPPTEQTAAIQAIQQASDPSAVVAALANGAAVDPKDPKLFEAYVSRMVDLGLPELAYHQAETLTTLESNDGLAWGVLAYVHARKGEMPEAVSAINLAGQFAHTNLFVQRTAGEIVAWYDAKADKTSLPDNARDGLTKVRALMEKEPAFTVAYNTAKAAYQSQAAAPQASAQTAPGPNQYQYPPTAQAPGYPQGYSVPPPDYYAATAPPSPGYYPDYYADWGPGWAQPAPWWWWQPYGFFGGSFFFPFSTGLVFDNRDFFFHHHGHDFFHHDRDDFFHHDGHNSFNHGQSFHHDGMNVAFHDSNHAFFHQDGKSTFFGSTARPNASMGRSWTANSHSANTFASSGGAMHIPFTPAHSQTMAHGNLGMTPWAPQFSSGMHGSSFHGQTFASPHMMPHSGMASHSMMPASHGAVGAGFHGGGSFHGGGGGGAHVGGGGAHGGGGGGHGGGGGGHR